MLRSMYSAISGLRAHQTKMDVTGNNIANVNTVGFKSSQTVFEDTLSQLMRSGAPAAQARGGTNPAQVGLGVKLAGITTNFSQGSTQSTGRSTDFLIQGDGFFVTRAGTERLYTRAGSFDFDGTGNLVTPGGTVLQGWTAVGGVVNTNGPIGDLRVPVGQVMNPVATRNGTVGGNLPAGDPIGATWQYPVSMYDAQGVEQQVIYDFTKTADNVWRLDVRHADGGAPMHTEALTFAADGSLATPATGQTTFTPPAAYASWQNPVTIDVSGLSQFGGQSTVAAIDQDGYPLGSLQSFSLLSDGTLVGVYSNQLRQPLGQLALASFANPAGLEKAGNSAFRAGDNSGLPLVGVAGAGGRGQLSSGALEMSNVDLAEEFTGLIVAQRGFQANSRVITSSDELLQDLVNLKR